MKQNRHSIKDDRWFGLNRTSVNMGSTVKDSYDEYILNNNEFIQTKIDYTPALVKMVNEILDNAVDALQEKRSAKIEVLMDDYTCTIKDNGDGIPINLIENLNGDKILIPFACWGIAKSGSNYNNDEKDETTIGTNGVGSYYTNVLCKKFVGTTCDGTKQFKGTWIDNAHPDKYIEDISIKKSKGTTVYLEPDFNRLDSEKFSDDVKMIIKQRLVNLSLSYNNIKFYYNKELIKVDLKNLVMESTYYTEDKFSILVSSNTNDDFESFSIINGLNIKRGSHIDYILRYIIQEIKDSLPKKYKDIKPGDIKNKLKILFIGKDFPKMQFESQTKETLKNSAKEVSQYLGEDWKFLVKDILKNKDIKQNILDYYDMKADFEAKKALKGLVKPSKKIKIEKYKPAINNKQYLMVSEGLSAGGAILTATGRDNIGAYPLKGKPLNCYTASITQIKKNQEIKDILEILGIDLSSDLSKLKPNYDNILIATDADVDGSHITMLLLTFFMKYYPEFIKQNRMKCLITPVIITYIKDKPNKAFFNIDDYIIYQQENIKHEAKYKKGLASITDVEYEWLFAKGIEPYIETLEWSDDLPEVFDAWMGDDSNKRKELLVGASFDIFNS